MMRATSEGRVPPLVSHSTRQSAPASVAASRTRRQNAGSSFQPSKKCSRSKITSRPAFFSVETVSAIMRRSSSSVVCSTSRTWAFHDLPTTTTAGVSALSSAVTWGSLAACPPGLRVEPKAATRECRRPAFAMRWKNSASLRFDRGKPPSM